MRGSDVHFDCIGSVALLIHTSFPISKRGWSLREAGTGGKKKKKKGRDQSLSLLLYCITIGW